MKKFETKEDALKYCFENIKQSILGKDDYNKFKQYMYRYRRGDTLKDNAIKSLFERMGVKEHCYFTADPDLLTDQR